MLIEMIDFEKNQISEDFFVFMLDFLCIDNFEISFNTMSAIIKSIPMENRQFYIYTLDPRAKEFERIFYI